MSRSPALKREDDRGEPNAWEKALMVASVAFTVLLFSYLVYQAVTAPAASPPEASVLSTEVTPQGDVRVVVRLVNAGSAGLLMAEVEVRCGEQPPKLTFENVPAEGAREGRVVCPPGTQQPEASVTSYILA